VNHDADAPEYAEVFSEGDTVRLENFPSKKKKKKKKEKSLPQNNYS